MGRVVFTVLAVIAVIAYPLVIYFGLSKFQVRAIAPVLGAIALVGLLFRLKGARRAHWGAVLPAPLSVLALAFISAVFNDHRFILAMPVMVSVALLISFGGSLRRPISMVERFARLQNPELPDEHVIYCRSVTKVWCLFFVLNAGCAAALTLWAPLAWWTLYTGFIAYVLMGALGAAEYIYRKYRFREYGSGLHDRVLQSIFPPGVS